MLCRYHRLLTIWHAIRVAKLQLNLSMELQKQAKTFDVNLISKSSAVSVIPTLLSHARPPLCLAPSLPLSVESVFIYPSPAHQPVSALCPIAYLLAPLLGRWKLRGSHRTCVHFCFRNRTPLSNASDTRSLSQRCCSEVVLGDVYSGR